MPKLDFSSLKTADLRSVAPLNDGIRPGAALPQEQEPAVHEPSAGISALVSPAPSAQPVAYSAPAATPVAVAVPPAPSVAAEVQRREPSRPHVAPARKISLTSLKSGGPCVVSKPVVQNAESVPVSVEPVAQELPKLSQHAPVISLVKKDESAVGVPAIAEPRTIDEAPASEISVHQPVEGVDIIAPAKVIGTEGEAKALEILAEAMSDPEEAKKKAMDKAAEAIVIPEAAKEFFPNLEMDDDFFKDPLFDGIVPHKEAAAEAVIEAPIAVVEDTAPVEAAEVAENREAPQDETVVAVESVPAIEEVPADVAAVTEASVTETVAEDVPVAVAEVPVIEESATVAVQDVQQPQEAYVEVVAKDLSSERKGGLAKLFGERKILVRSLAGFFLVAFLSVGAFAFLSPSVKTSGPEALPPAPGVTEPRPTVTPPAPVVTDDAPFTRIHSVRRPNHRKMPTDVSGPGPEIPKTETIQEEALHQSQPQASGSAASPNSEDLPPNAP